MPKNSENCKTCTYIFNAVLLKLNSHITGCK